VPKLKTKRSVGLITVRNTGKKHKPTSIDEGRTVTKAEAREVMKAVTQADLVWMKQLLGLVSELKKEKPDASTTWRPKDFSDMHVVDGELYIEDGRVFHWIVGMKRGTGRLERGEFLRMMCTFFSEEVLDALRANGLVRTELLTLAQAQQRA
jgi:hypothetical protein